MWDFAGVLIAVLIVVNGIVGAFLFVSDPVWRALVCALFLGLGVAAYRSRNRVRASAVWAFAAVLSLVALEQFAKALK
jgi:hypothetical protein